jgi:hypothetical protein
MERIDEILTLAPQIVMIASAAANLTPTNSDNLIVELISKIINFLALNWRKKPNV